MRFPNAVRQDAAVEAWFVTSNDDLRSCYADVRELLNDGHPIACVEDAAFGYVDAFAGHVNVGFFHGASLDDPGGLLEGSADGCGR